MPFTFAHESLDAYRLAVEAARWFRAARWPSGTAALRDQGVRAIQSTALNIAEGRSNSPRARANHYRIALASAGECDAILEILGVHGCPVEEGRRLLARIGAMLWRMSRRE